MNYLLDTNAVSEVMKASPEPAVLRWLKENEESCFLSAITIGEIERGIELLSVGRKKQHLQRTFQELLEAAGERVLGLDLSVMRHWAVLTAAAQRRGHRLSVLDSLIEATALYWDLTVVTRNTDDFFQARLFNPWKQ